MSITEQKRKEIMLLAGTIKDEINIMCATKKPSELGIAYVQAKRNLEKLSTMIYEERFKKNEIKLMQLIYDEWFKSGDNNDT